jgi:hypothetical protein
LRPFGLAVHKSSLKKNSSTYCIGNQPESKIILDSIERFIIARQKEGLPYFLFSFLWKLSHDQASEVEKLDQMITEFFQNLFNGGHFEDTIIFGKRLLFILQLNKA